MVAKALLYHRMFTCVPGAPGCCYVLGVVFAPLYLHMALVFPGTG